MKEDDQTPLLLGRPFLNTARAVIEVHEGKISFNIGDENITFQIGRSMKYPSYSDSICKADQIDELVQELMNKDPVLAAKTFLLPPEPPDKAYHAINAINHYPESDKKKRIDNTVPDHLSRVSKWPSLGEASIDKPLMRHVQDPPTH